MDSTNGTLRDFLLPAPRDVEQIGSSSHFRWLGGIAVAVFLMSFADAVLTLHWVGSAQAIEGNPFMDALLGFDVVAFLLGKQLLVGAGLHALWRLRRYRMAVVAIFVAFLAYYGLLLYHLQALDVGLLGGLDLIDPLFAAVMGGAS